MRVSSLLLERMWSCMLPLQTLAQVMLVDTKPEGGQFQMRVTAVSTCDTLEQVFECLMCSRVMV